MTDSVKWPTLSLRKCLPDAGVRETADVPFLESFARSGDFGGCWREDFGAGEEGVLSTFLRLIEDRSAIAGRLAQWQITHHGLKPTLCQSSALWYMIPLVITYSTLRVLRMSSSGLPLIRMRSPRFPFSRVPDSFSSPMARAGTTVAA